MYKRFHEVYQNWVDRELRNEAVYNTTKMRKIILLFLSVVLIGGNLLLTGCEVDYYQEPEPTEGSGSSIFEEGVTVPEGFNWSTIKTGELSVKVDDRYNGQYFYQVEVYDANPIIYRDAGLLAKGVAKKGQDWVGSLSLPTALETVYVRQVSPVGQGVVKVATLSENGIKVDFTPATPSGTKMASSGVSQGSIPMSTRSGDDGPSTVYTTPAINGATVLGLSGEKNVSFDHTSAPTYVIPAGETFKGTLTFNWKNSTLYVEGTWENTGSSNIALNGWTVIVQNGGKFINHAANKTFTVNDVSQLIVAAGGKFGETGTPMKLDQGNSNNSKIINSGMIVTSGLTKIRYLYNRGDFNLNGKTEQIDNSCNIVNKGDFIVNNGTGNANAAVLQGNFQNDGTVRVLGTLHSGSNNFVLTNTGFFEVHTLGLAPTATSASQGTIHNTGQFVVTNDMFLQLTFNIGTGALLEVKNLTMLNSSINLKHEAMLVVTEKLTIARSGSKKLITGPANGDALARINEVSFIDVDGQIGRSFELGGELEVECSNYTVLPSPGDPEEEGRITGEDVSFVKVGESTVKIPESDYNKGGNNNQVTGTPSNPVFPIIFDGSPLTYMFEDNWPFLGDYDMNDLVLDVVPTYTIENESNKVTRLILNATLRAVGATKRLAVGIQLDGIAPGDISSVARVNDAGLNGQIFTRSNGLETGQTYAVIPVFDDAHNALGYSTPLVINTVKDSKNNMPPVTVEFTINFSSPTDLARITVDKFNVFIVNGGYDGKRWEVHMPGFEPTQKADRSRFDKFDDRSYTKNYYTSSENMIWGLAVPGPAKYPREWTSVKNAYKQLQDWAISGGANSKDWYKYPDEGKIFSN